MHYRCLRIAACLSMFFIQNRSMRIQSNRLMIVGQAHFNFREKFLFRMTLVKTSIVQLFHQPIFLQVNFFHNRLRITTPDNVVHHVLSHSLIGRKSPDGVRMSNISIWSISTNLFRT